MSHRHTIIIACVEGYSASSRKSEENISYTLAEMMAPTINKDKSHNRIVTKIFNSAAPAVQRHARDFVIDEIKKCASSYSVYFIGKSMGGAKLYYIIKKLMKKHNDILRYAKEVRVAFIDAHGNPWFDFDSIRPFGKYHSIKIPNKWYRKVPRLSIYGAYQHQHFPRGAKIYNAEYCIEITTPTDHFKMIKHPLVKSVLSLNYLACRV